MSLLEQAMQDCVVLKQTRQPEPEGGWITTWAEDGPPFKAAITFDTSMEARVAEQQGVTSRYTVTTNKDKVLMYHDVIKRLSDGKIFRATSDGDDVFTPASAFLNMRQVTAEEWKLPM